MFRIDRRSILLGFTATIICGCGPKPEVGPPPSADGGRVTFFVKEMGERLELS